jgi:hypothetical protein
VNRLQTLNFPPVFGRPSPSAWLVLTLLSLGLAGCHRDEVAHFRVPKTTPPPALTSPASMDGRPAMPGPGAGTAASGGEVPPPPTPGKSLRWMLPKGWTENLSGGMRYATLKPSTAGRIEVTVVVLPGPAGGELANVNRWRNQIGLPPLDEMQLDSARKRIATKAGPVAVFDFESEGQAKSRLIAALTASEGNTWFVKMVGDTAPVGAARPDFIRLLESLRFDAPN